MRTDERTSNLNSDVFTQLWNATIARFSPRQELALLARALWRVGYNDDTRGHLTYRLHNGNILVNSYGPMWGQLRARDVAEMDATGALVSGDALLSPALQVHLELHRRRPDIRIAVHHHPEYGTVWAGANRMPEAYDQNSAYVDPAKTRFLDEYGGSFDERDVSARTAQAVGDADFVFLGHHGVLVLAEEIWQAYWRAYCLEWRCRLAWRIDALGGGRPMPEQAQELLRDKAVRSGLKYVIPWDAAANREVEEDRRVLDEGTTSGVMS
jgi:ribulose-5-phosphate 4-epimerase/fuculose-1-phosphate aldolase